MSLRARLQGSMPVTAPLVLNGLEKLLAVERATVEKPAAEG